jgi:PAS domain-containing protein
MPMADVTVEAVSAVVAQAYEAAYDQKRWFDAVSGLRDLFGGSRSCIVRLSVSASSAISTVHDPELNSPEASAIYMRDPLGVKVVGLPVGTVHDYARIDGETAWRGNEVWQDWFRPRDMYHGLACNLLSSNDAHWLLDVHRGSRQEAFSASDIELLQKIVPHMLRAGQIGRQLENTSALASAFSHLPFGVFLVNGHQHIAHMNEAAESMLIRSDSPLRLSDGMIVAASAGDTQELQRLVADACSLRDGVMPGIGGTLLVRIASNPTWRGWCCRSHHSWMPAPTASRRNAARSSW